MSRGYPQSLISLPPPVAGPSLQPPPLHVIPRNALNLDRGIHALDRPAIGLVLTDPGAHRPRDFGIIALGAEWAPGGRWHSWPGRVALIRTAAATRLQRRMDDPPDRSARSRSSFPSRTAGVTITGSPCRRVTPDGTGHVRRRLREHRWSASRKHGFGRDFRFFFVRRSPVLPSPSPLRFIKLRILLGHAPGRPGRASDRRRPHFTPCTPSGSPVALCSGPFSQWALIRSGSVYFDSS